MTTAFAAHLIRRYATRHHHLGDYTGGLPKLKLQSAIDYIHAYLDRDLSVGELALDRTHESLPLWSFV